MIMIIIMIIIIITGNILIKYNMLADIVNCIIIIQILIVSLSCDGLYFLCLRLQMCLVVITIIMNLIGKEQSVNQYSKLYYT